MKTFRLALLGSVVVGVGATAAFAADVEKKVEMYGFVNRMVSIQGDGDTVLFNHHDNSIASSRFGVKATAKSANLTIGGRFEWQFQGGSNSTGTTTQIRNTAGSMSNDAVRWSDVSFGTKYGTLFIGHGDSSFKDTVKQDLSGTDLVLYSGEPLSGGMGWSPENNAKQYSGGAGGNETANAYQVRDTIQNLDGRGRTNRARYDTPSFAGFGGTISSEHGGDASYALTYGGDLGDFKIKGKIAHANMSGTSTNAEEVYGGSLSVLHSSGVNGTYAYGIAPNRTGGGGGNSAPANTMGLNGEGRLTTHYGKVGYQRDFFDFGKTALGIDYNLGYDGVTDGDRAWKMGVGAVQNMKDYGAELYAAYEWLGFDRGDRVGNNAPINTTPSRHYNDIHAGYIGARVKW